MDNRLKDIKATLMLYTIRNVQIEDFRLRLEELKTRNTLKAQGYEESVQTSTVCKNNDSYLYEVERLQKLIKTYTVSNKRVENMLGYIIKPLHKDVIMQLYLEKKSSTEVARSIGRSKRQVKRIEEEALETIYENIEMS